MYRILELNPQLQSFAGDIDLRMFLYRATKGRLLPEGGTLNEFANAHEYFGVCWFGTVSGGLFFCARGFFFTSDFPNFYG